MARTRLSLAWVGAALAFPAVAMAAPVVHPVTMGAGTSSASAVTALRQQASALAQRIQAQGVTMAQLDEKANVQAITRATLQAKVRRAEGAARAEGREVATMRALAIKEAVFSYTNQGGPPIGQDGKMTSAALISMSYAEAVELDEERSASRYASLLAKDKDLVGALGRQQSHLSASTRALRADQRRAATQQARLEAELAGLKGRLGAAVRAAQAQAQQAEQERDEAIWQHQQLASAAKKAELATLAPTTTRTTRTTTTTTTAAPTTTSSPPTTSALSRTAAPSTTAAAAPPTTATTTPVPPSTTRAQPTTTNTAAPTTLAPASTTLPPGSVTGTTVPGQSSTTTLAPSNPGSSTSAPTTSAPTTSAPVSSGPTTTSPTGTAPVTTTPVTTTPVTTTPTSVPTVTTNTSPPPSISTTVPPPPGTTTTTLPHRVGPGNPPPPGRPPHGYQVAIAFAESQIGKPYQWGGAGPKTYDCSGLVMVSWGKAGVELPHSAQYQYDMTARVSIPNLLPGDLVFFGTPKDVYHVGLYLGGGRMVDAPETGEDVQIQSIFEPHLLAGGQVK